MHIAGSAMAHAARTDFASRPDTAAQSAVRPFVRELLERSPAFAQLDVQRRQAIAADTVAVAAYLAQPADPASQAKDFVQAVDFPAFVDGLINGVFSAIVDASIEQMEAYGELVQAVSKSLDDFVKDNVSDDRARDYLKQDYPDLVPPEQGGADTTQPPCPRRLLAAMMTAGIARITGCA